MKFILIFTMCSLVNQECVPSWQDEDAIKFMNYSDCRIYGHRLAGNILETIGKDVDKARIIINFNCKEIVEKLNT